MTASQDEIIGFLSTGAAYGLPGAEVERVETHCSVIFLVDDRAYKLKRAVAFSSLDYTSVDRRETACRAELTLNRRTAPELYLGLHAVRRRPDGGLALDGEGIAVDWLVAMRRFDQDDLFDRLADDGRLTPELTSLLADEIARFHDAAERTPGFGGADGLRIAIERNRCDLETVEAILGSNTIETWYRATREALDRVAPLLDRRRDAGRVRQCHGDLRLANICLLDGRPTLFDAIEFSDQVSCIDVLFDLAFLLMDLHHRGLDLPANILFNRYVDGTNNDDGLAALSLMLSARAATRAYALAGSVQRQARRAQAQQRAAAARSHLAMALSLLASSPSHLVALGGIDGSGKASLAYDLAARLRSAPGARVLRSETARRRLLDLAPGTRLPATAYDAAMNERVYARLAADAAQALAAGFTVLVEDSFIDAAHRQAIAAASAQAEVPFVGLWLGAPRDLDGAGGAPGPRWHIVERTTDLASILALAQPSA